MNVAMLGLIQSLRQVNMSETSTDSTKGDAFASLFASLVAKPSEERETGAESLLASLFEEVSDLLAFLQTEEVGQTSEIQQLIAQVALTNEDEDLLVMVQGQLQLTDEQWTTMLERVEQTLQSLVPEDVVLLMNQPKEGQQLDATEQIENVLQVLAYLAQMPPEQFVQIVDKDVTDVVKTGKLLDVLLAHRDAFAGGNDKQRDQLTHNLKQVSEKLEVLLQANKEASRRDILLKVFAPFKSEVTSETTGQVKQVVPEIIRPDIVGNQMIHFQQVPKAEQLTLMLESNGRQTSTEQLIKQFNAILSKSQFFKEGGTQRLFIRLHPEHLGAMRIELIQRNQTMVARILTTTAMARNMLDSQIDSLKQAFTNQNIQVERVEVSQQMTQQDRFLPKDGEAKQESERQNEKKENDDKELTESFGTTFEDALVNVKV